jgi:hypothetical protein
MGVEADGFAGAELVGGVFERATQRGEQLDEQLEGPSQESKLGRSVVPDHGPPVADGADHNMSIEVDGRDFKKICPPSSTLATWRRCRRVCVDARIACCPEPFARRILDALRTRRLLPLAPENFANRSPNCSSRSSIS